MSTDHVVQKATQCAKCRAVESPGGLLFRPCSLPSPLPGTHCTNRYCSPSCRQSHEGHRCVVEQGMFLVCMDQNFRKVRPFTKWCYAGTSSDLHHDKAVFDCPCTELIGISLQIREVNSSWDSRYPDTRRALSPDTPLRVPTIFVGDLLMMDPDNGWLSTAAPWKESACSRLLLLINRKDGKSLFPETLETILEFLLMVQEDMSGTSSQNGWSPMREYFTPQAFQHFSRRYFKEQREKGRDTFEGPLAPL